MKSITLLPLLLVTLAAAPSTVSAMNFTVDTATCDGDPFSNLALSVMCDGGNSKCGFGDTATVEGTVEATSAFSDNNVTFEACMMNAYCPDEYSRSAGTLCDWLEPADGQECGAAGAYSIYAEEEIPDAADMVSDGWTWMVTVRIGVEHDECEREASGDSNRSAYSAMGLASLALGATAAVARRRRRIDRERRQDEKASGFLEMSGARVVV